jgi:hypothetical protein
MAGVVTFDFTEWLLAYPEFGGITEQSAKDMFFRTTLFIDNLATSPFCDLTQRKWILYMGTAHMAALFATFGSVVPSPLQPPGRIASAGEGSVNASFDFIAAKTNVQAFWNQTKYGAAVYAATLAFRTGFYVAGPLRQNPIGSVFGAFPWLR